MKKILNAIKDKFIDLIGLYRQIKTDRDMFRFYKETLESEYSDKESDFVKMNLKYDPDTHKIICVTSIPNEFQQSGHDYMIYDKLNENTFFITEFLRKTLEFNDYVSGIPSFFHIEDPTADDISLTYLAIWDFVPMIDSKLKKKLIIWPVCSLIFILGIITGILMC